MAGPKSEAGVFTRADADVMFHMFAAARHHVAGNADAKDFHKRRAYAATGDVTPEERKIMDAEDAAREAAAKAKKA